MAAMAIGAEKPTVNLKIHAVEITDRRMQAFREEK